MEDKRISPVRTIPKNKDQVIHEEVSEVKEVGNDDEDHLEELELEESEENPPMNTVADPGCPTQQEIDDHYKTHMPFRAWCPCCVQGKAKEDPHYSKKRKPSNHTKPTCCMDYK